MTVVDFIFENFYIIMEEYTAVVVVVVVVVIIIILIFMQGIYNYSLTRVWRRIMHHLVYSDKYFVARID